ncbi:MAG TPA: YdeI/OmpD-associated family protein, partial [Chthoniobacterales bacterium]|nr:YdeI/OmpD-associated family protein [Chthoniobacterales bacterium]
QKMAPQNSSAFAGEDLRSGAMPKTYRFRAPIKATHGGGGGAFVEIPFDAEKAFGKKRIPIRATIDGESYRGSLVRMGGDCHLLLILKSIREKIRKKAGDKVSVTVWEDTAPRTVIVPPDVSRALRTAPSARAFFQELSFTHKREYIEWIRSARQAETRERRIERLLELLRQNKKER